MSVRAKRVGSRRHAPLAACVGWVLLLSSAPLGACGGDKDPPRPGRKRGINLFAENAPAVAKGTIGEAPPLPPSAAEGTGQPSAEANTDPKAEKEPRDFNAELVRMLGNPASCLDPHPVDNAPPQIDIALSTNVMPSGSVSSSSVSAAGLSANEVGCLRGRVESLHFAPPIENAPFSVHGSVRLTRNNAPPPARAETIAEVVAAPALPSGPENQGTPLPVPTQDVVTTHPPPIEPSEPIMPIEVPVQDVVTTHPPPLNPNDDNP
jgi:hypothetical protein